MSKIEKKSAIPPENSDYFQVRAEKGKKVKTQSRNSDLPVFGQKIQVGKCNYTLYLDWHCSVDREKTQRHAVKG